MPVKLPKVIDTVEGEKRENNKGWWPRSTWPETFSAILLRVLTEFNVTSFMLFFFTFLKKGGKGAK